MGVVTKSWEDGDLLLYHRATKIKTKAINEENKIISKLPTFLFLSLFNAILQHRKAHILLKTKTKRKHTDLYNYVITYTTDKTDSYMKKPRFTLGLTSVNLHSFVHPIIKEKR